MALIKLKDRPLDRDIQTYRDDRLILIACDDTYAPKQYFNFFRIPRLQISVIATTDGSSVAEHVLSRLLEYKCNDDDERWLLLDTDHCIEDAHLRSFTSALTRAKELNINVALSRSCFEVWLLLHHKDYADIAPLGNAKSVEDALTKTLGAYNKRSLKPDDFPIEFVKNAYIRAKALDEDVLGGSIPNSTTTRVYKIWESIFRKLSPTSSMYEELKPIMEG